MREKGGGCLGGLGESRSRFVHVEMKTGTARCRYREPEGWLIAAFKGFWGERVTAR